jgi:steroid 5-alpha reductase family enzyme
VCGAALRGYLRRRAGSADGTQGDERRVLADGKDRRFDVLKTKASSFFVAWTLQGLWVFLTGLPVYALNAQEASGVAVGEGWSALDAVLLSVWAVGFAVEFVADRQKREFRSNPANHDKFITSGLWAFSRHPNYAGRITYSWALALFAARGLPVGPWSATSLGPAFESLLLLFVSGIPLLERDAEKRWGDAYRAYAASVPVLFPL